MRVIEICVEEAAGRVPVIAGAGSNSTDEAISLHRHAKEVGADAVLSVTGYYNKPSQEGSTAISRRWPRRWTFPSCSTTSPAAPSWRSASRPWRGCRSCPNIIGVKDATANLMRPTRERNACAQGLAAGLGRGRHRAGLHGPWRPWLHLGDGECGAQAVRRIPGRLPAGRLRPGPRAAGQIDAAA